MHTPHVAATSFFIHRTEIFDFVTERVKRCIAANRDEVFGEIFYKHNVVVNDTYFTYTKMGGGM